MQTSLVVTIVAPDRPGIVSAVSAKAAEFDANWGESVMANMAGQFAGILHVQVPSKNVDLLAKALIAMQSSSVQICVARASSLAAATPAASTNNMRRIKLDLVGHDRPGIIRAISDQLASLGVSIDRLTTSIVSGAMSGESMFRMQAELRLPRTLKNEELRDALEGLANELMVDIELDD
jgi:glycine cleavage system regulatory protein